MYCCIRGTFEFIKDLYRAYPIKIVRASRMINCNGEGRGKINEVLLKCLVHNICCLVEEIFEKNIDINFSLCAEHYFAHKER